LYLPPERAPAMPNVLSLDPKDLERFLDRRRANPPTFPAEMDLAENLVAVLRKANEFVPSEAGSILLDDPRRKHKDRSRNQLTFLAVFGERAGSLIGQTIPADRGIAGWTYQSGSAYYSTDVAGDPHFDAQVDRETAYSTRSLVAIPIRIESEVCGVLELLNRRGASGYGPEDRDLLEIFAGYISIAIQNVLDGRIAQEVAKRDNLTGLYNDRYLHSAIDQAIEECGVTGEDLALLFLDLDYFKHINDRHGHLAGSQVLREVGGLLHRRFGESRAITARYGGDEFVIVVPGLGQEEGRQLAEELRRTIAAAVYCGQPGEISSEVLDLRGLTCSIGVSHLRGVLEGSRSASETKRRLLREADAAMYRAKEGGRDQVAVAVPADLAAPPTALTPPKGA
jgi:diguanylate cyclase (GGDEF)-like protein